MRKVFQLAVLVLAPLAFPVNAANKHDVLLPLSTQHAKQVIAALEAGVVDAKGVPALPNVPGRYITRMTVLTGIHTVEADANEDYFVLNSQVHNTRYVFAFTTTPRIAPNAAVPSLPQLLANRTITQYHVTSISGANHAVTELACLSRKQARCQV